MRAEMEEEGTVRGDEAGTSESMKNLQVWFDYFK